MWKNMLSKIFGKIYFKPLVRIQGSVELAMPEERKKNDVCLNSCMTKELRSSTIPCLSILNGEEWVHLSGEKSCKFEQDPAPYVHELRKRVTHIPRKGYIVVRNLFSAEEVAQTCSEISSICTQWYADYLKTGQEDAACDEIANRRPAWKATGILRQDRRNSASENSSVWHAKRLLCTQS